ncbi:MAG: hypothetical protein COA98_07815 [Candidatus Neomarinimicrobiota bacterium]|jgi:hypothetical protein|nr:MAG: hypothetical protein COA98_07815 [Candidatus Neomarinimicrobiota bacterium]
MFVLGSFLSAQWGWGADDAVVEVDNGAMNYSNGWITATGIGGISPLAQNPGMARGMAVRAAKIDAMRNLLETVLALTVTSETAVRGAAVENDVIKTKVEGMVKGARIRDINEDGRHDTNDFRYLSDTSIEIEMEIHMSGISSIVLPPAGYAEAQAGVAPPSAGTSAPISGSTTGLIIDARGVGARPAMSPKIVDQNGGVVYGPSSFTRDYAIKFGVAGYSKDIETAKSDPRVVGNPLIVRGIGVQGSNGTDIVVANGDAATIRRAESSGKILSSCKVMIILD